ALIGGYDPGEARALARIAAKFGVPFLNVGSEEDALRDTSCYPTTFHIAPSTTTMAASTIGVAASQDASSLFFVLVRDEGEEELLLHLSEVAEGLGLEVVGHAMVDAGQYVYYPVINELTSSQADAAILVLSAESQEVFLSQAA